MKQLLSIIATIFLLASCQRDNSMEIQKTGRVQGTTYHITYIDSSGRDFQSGIDSVFKAVDQSVSTYNPKSLVSQINKGDTSVTMDAVLRDLWEKSRYIAGKTEGYFDPTVGPVVKFWGFGPDQKRVADSTKVDSLLQFTGLDKIFHNEQQIRLPDAGFFLDFNAIAQGYTVDLVAEMLEAEGVRHYMVEVGGEVRARGKNIEGKYWRIGIDRPTEKIDQQNRFQAIVKLKSAALATSGNYRKFWTDSASGVKYAHTINPKTGFPAKNRLLSVSLIADKAVNADAYATALMAMGQKKALEFLEKHPQLSGYLIISDEEGNWEVIQTEGFEKAVVN